MRVFVSRGDVLETEALDEVGRALGSGELLIYPTDTLYALGGLCHDPAVALRVRAAKRRDDAKPLPVIVADEAQAREISAHWPTAAARLAAGLWPGPLTLVVRAAPSIPSELHAGTGTVAVRVPARGIARALCRIAGPLISTSANPSGGAPPTTFAEAVRDLGPEVAVGIDGGAAAGALPSTIVDVSSGEPRLVRAGAVPWAEIERVWLRSRA